MVLTPLLFSSRDSEICYFDTACDARTHAPTPPPTLTPTRRPVTGVPTGPTAVPTEPGPTARPVSDGVAAACEALPIRERDAMKAVALDAYSNKTKDYSVGQWAIELTDRSSSVADTVSDRSDSTKSQVDMLSEKIRRGKKTRGR